MTEATIGCPQHRLCAYTGAEPDLCPVCHRSWEVITGRDERLASHHSQSTQKPFSPRPEGIVRALHRQSHGSTGTPRPGKKDETPNEHEQSERTSSPHA